MKLLWTHEALTRLIEIEGYIAHDSPVRAREFRARLIKRVQSISNNPRKGRIVPEFSLPDLRELIYKNYRIVYRIINNTVEILTVFESHGLIRIKGLKKNRSGTSDPYHKTPAR
jgi:toxin ParE1/3/4